MRKPVKGPALLYQKSVAKKDRVEVIAVEDSCSSIMVGASESKGSVTNRTNWRSQPADGDPSGNREQIRSHAVVDGAEEKNDGPRRSVVGRGRGDNKRRQRYAV